MDLNSLFIRLKMPTSLYNGSQNHHHARGMSFDDSDPFLSSNKHTSRGRAVQENGLLRSFAVDKERANNVAKIKVVVGLLDTDLLPKLVAKPFEHGFSYKH